MEMNLSEAILVAVPLSTFIITCGQIIIKRIGSDTKKSAEAINRPAPPIVVTSGQGHCYEHEGIVGAVQEIKVVQKEVRAELLKKSDDLWDEVKVIQADVKTLLKNGRT